MSKPSAPRVYFPALWIVVILIVATLVIVAADGTRAGHPRAAVTTSPQPLTASPATRTRIQASYAALPLAFEANEGQADPDVKYMARGEGYRLLLTSTQAVMTVSGKRRYSEVLDMMMNKRRSLAERREQQRRQMQIPSGEPQSTATLRMNLLGAGAHPQLVTPQVVAEDLQQGKVNYFIGRDRSKWRSNIPLYGRVSYRDVFPGVDLAFHGAAKQLEFDYLVKPGADASAIALNIDGADSIQTNPAGDLVVATSAGPVELHRPVAYQTKNGTREAVDARFVLKGNEVAFALGPYDHSRELVIDPVVTYSTYFGGNADDYGVAIAVDASGNAYVAGDTESATIPGPNGTTVVPNNNGAGAGNFFDTFVTKIDPSGKCVFTTFFGGSTDDLAGGIAVDKNGIYVVGTTDSNDFPATVGDTTPPAAGAHGSDAGYAVRLALSGSTFVWGTYIGGSDETTSFGVAVDGGDNFYVVGNTFAADLLGGSTDGSVINLGSGSGFDDGYLAKISSNGTTFPFVGFIGGSDGDLATGVALDGAGNIYIAGQTISVDFPVTPGVVQTKCGTDGTCNGGPSNAQDDAFAVAIKANLSGYIYATYYGGSKVDDAFAITVDSGGDAFLTGRTTSSDFPTSGTPYQGTLNGPQNAFVVELDPAATSAIQSTYFGGNGTDSGLGIALDNLSPANVYLTGQTSSSQNFPLFNPNQSALSGSSDAFVSALNWNQSSLLYSSYLGGGGDEDQIEGSIGLDSSQNIYVTGDTDSGNGSTAAFPTSNALDGTYGGGGTCTFKNISGACTDAFIAAFTPATAPDFGITDTALSPSSVSPGASATSTITVTPINGYTGTVDLACKVSGNGSPLPTCSLNPTSGSSSTLTVATSGSSAALLRGPSIFYGAWLPIVGLSLAGMGFATTTSRRKKLFGVLLLGMLMAILFFLPACSSSSSTPPPPCNGCTPAGSYTVTVTGTDSVNSSLTHPASPTLTLTVN